MVKSSSNFHRNCIILCLNKIQLQFVLNLTQSIFQNQSDGRLTVEQVHKIIIFSHILMKNSPIFFKFSQELYYIMLKQNPVTVCHKSDPVRIQKLKRWPLFDDRKTSKSRKYHHFQPYLNEKQSNLLQIFTGTVLYYA